MAAAYDQKNFRPIALEEGIILQFIFLILIMQQIMPLNT